MKVQNELVVEFWLSWWRPRGGEGVGSEVIFSSLVFEEKVVSGERPTYK